MNIEHNGIILRHPKTRDFFKLMQLYSVHWDEWTKTSACPLSEKEIIVLKNFYDTAKHDLSCNVLNIPFDSASTIFMRGKRLLSASYSDYLLWVAISDYEKKGIIKHYSNTEKFLSSPLFFLPIKKELKEILMRLPYTDYNTMRKILALYSEAELKELRGMGKIRLLEFKAMLKKKNCLQLLRSK